MPKLLSGLVALSTALVLAACGSSSSKSSSSSSSSAQNTLSLTISESGKTASYSGPATFRGGVVRVTLHNTGKSPHGMQLVKVLGNHTINDAYTAVNSNNNKTPNWVRGYGGVSTTQPGANNSATVMLDAGKYLVTDMGGPGPSTSQPPKFQLTVSGSGSGSLPSTSASVVAAAQGKDKYAWQISGLKAGHNELTFKSEGAQAVHLIAAFKLKPGQNPSEAQIEKTLTQNGPPPFADVSTLRESAVLDGGRSQVTTLDLQPGTYVFFCPLSDRDGGKPHLAEGMLKKVTVT